MENPSAQRNRIRTASLIYVLFISLSFFLYSCTVVEVRDSDVELPSASAAQKTESDAKQSAEEEPNVVNKEAERKTKKAAEVAGAVLATVATVWLITEYIEEKVVPAVIGLTVAYLIYQSSRNSEVREMN